MSTSLSVAKPSRRQAVYSGTFDPITLGHLDIVQKAAKLFDSVIVAVAMAHHKKTLFSLDERLVQVKAACAHIDNVLVMPFEGLMVQFCQAHGAVALVKGVRNSTDLDYEAQMAAMNKKMLPAIETVFLLPAPEVQCISSTLVREISKLGGDVRLMVPSHVLAALQTVNPSQTLSQG
jgi:pantetheine-phosphate adenylyltransferase